MGCLSESKNVTNIVNMGPERWYRPNMECNWTELQQSWKADKMKRQFCHPSLLIFRVGKI